MNNIARCIEFEAVPLIYEDSPHKRILVQVDDIVSVKENTENSCKISTRDGNTVSVYGSYAKIIDTIRETYADETESVQSMLDLIEHMQTILIAVYDTDGHISSGDMKYLIQVSDRLKELIKERVHFVSKENKDG